MTKDDFKKLIKENGNPEIEYKTFDFEWEDAIVFKFPNGVVINVTLGNDYDSNWFEIETDEELRLSNEKTRKSNEALRQYFDENGKKHIDDMIEKYSPENYNKMLDFLITNGKQ